MASIRDPVCIRDPAASKTLSACSTRLQFCDAFKHNLSRQNEHDNGLPGLPAYSYASNLTFIM